MNDDFEKRLQHAAPREVPAAWRQEILVTARSAAAQPDEPAPPKPSLLAVFVAWLANSSCRQRTALGGLAAAWIIILALNLATKASESPRLTQAISPPLTPETLEVLQQQRLLYAELAGPTKQMFALPPTPTLPGPRSQRREETFTV